MATVTNQFILDIYYNNKLYTVQQLLDYIEKVGKRFENDEKLSKITEETMKEASRLMNSYGLTVHSIVQRKASPAGKALTNLAYDYCNAILTKK